MSCLTPLLLLLLLCAAPLAARVQVADSPLTTVDTRDSSISNPSFSLDEAAGTMDIHFDLAGSPVIPATVTVGYSLTGNPPWLTPVAVSGTIGPGHSAGTAKNIRWDYADDGLLNLPGLGTTLYFSLTVSTAGGPATTTYLSTPAPQISPVIPTTVNFCFGHAAPLCVCPLPPSTPSLPVGHSAFVDRLQTMPPAMVPPAAMEEIRAATEAVFRAAGITTRSMTFQIAPPAPPSPGIQTINIYFCPVLPHSPALSGICTVPDDWALPDRFNRIPRAEVIVFYNDLSVPAWIPPVPGSEGWWSHSTARAMTAAHEIGHALGCFDVEDQTDPQASVMDHSDGIFNPQPASFSPLPLPVKHGLTIGESPVSHNETYHLRRWVEGVRAAGLQILTPGEWDLPGYALPPGAPGDTLAILSVAVTQPLYNVRVFYDNHSGVLHPVRHFPALTQAQLQQLEIRVPAGAPVYITGSTAPGGPANVVIAPPAAIAGADAAFVPLGNQELHTMEFPPEGAPANLGTGSLVSTLLPPVSHAITIRPAGYDGSHLLVQFDTVPGYRYTLEHSVDLNTWSTVAGMTDFTANSILTTFPHLGAGLPRRAFYKVNAAPPIP